jgi:hypothetical protein
MDGSRDCRRALGSESAVEFVGEEQVGQLAGVVALARVILLVGVYVIPEQIIVAEAKIVVDRMKKDRIIR